MSTDMNPKKPELKDFGVTQAEYDIYTRKSIDESLGGCLFAFVIVVIVTASIVFVNSWSWADILQWAFLIILLGWLVIGGLIVGFGRLIDLSIARVKKHRLLKSPVISQIKRYEAAETAYRRAQWEAWEVERKASRQQQEAKRAKEAALRTQRRKREKYWESLGGIEFEQELGWLYRARGYDVRTTPTSGDQGIDLILRKNDKTTVVQCKAQKRPAGPAVVRELFGSMVAYGADNAILACTGGFTDGVVKFARGKPISLISAKDIARMANAKGGETAESQQEMIPDQDIARVAEARTSEAQDTLVYEPVCPKHGCGRTMVLRNGRRGRFWGCPGYPTCRGTRNL